MIIKRATIENKNEILELYHSLVGTEYCAWTENYPNSETIDNDLARESLFCMLDENARIIGVITIDEDENVEKLPCWSDVHRPSKELSRLGVRSDVQNRGIAKKLLLFAMDELKKQGMKSVHFLVCKHNKKAIWAYDKLSFNVVGECVLYDEEWWCYEKEL